MQTKVKSHSRTVKGKGNSTVKTHVRKSPKLDKHLVYHTGKTQKENSFLGTISKYDKLTGKVTLANYHGGKSKTVHHSKLNVADI